MQDHNHEEDIPIVQPSAVIEPTAQLPVSGRGIPPVVMCMSPPYDPSRSVHLADRPSSSGSYDDNGHYDHHRRSQREVDSRNYVREMMNLSVELDHDDEVSSTETSTGSGTITAQHSNHIPSFTLPSMTAPAMRMLIVSAIFTAG
jgi:hypothetical protein